MFLLSGNKKTPGQKWKNIHWPEAPGAQDVLTKNLLGLECAGQGPPGFRVYWAGAYLVQGELARGLRGSGCDAFECADLHPCGSMCFGGVVCSRIIARLHVEFI